MNVECKTCNTPPNARKVNVGFISGMMLVILPKCPFCIMAYTSTAMLCGEGSLVELSKTHNSPLTIIITSLLGLITLCAIFFNKKGRKTWYAFAFALTGISMILFSVIQFGGQSLYYAGMIFVFVGVWLNGSLMWFWKSLKDVFQLSRKDFVG
jgi:hypothetical protein